MKELQTAIKAAKEAGEIVLEGFDKKHIIEMKTRRDIVTEIDIKSEAKIIEIINNEHPEHNILSEESGKINKQSDYLWIIDPLDGTTNYSMKNPFFDISIALVKKNEIILGVVYAPFTREMFHVEKNIGSFLNRQKISVSNVTEMESSLMVYCHGSSPKEIEGMIRIFSKIKPYVIDFNRMRAIGLELAFLAAGRIEACIVNGINSWDVAAGSLLVKEAGGKITDFENTDWKLGNEKQDHIHFLASNGKIHEKIIEKIKEIK